MKLKDALKWFDELEEDKDKNENEESIKTCLITREKIKNEITLKCGHSFEYDALLRHYILQKTGLRYYNSHSCPYCRADISHFIPYYENSLFATNSDYYYKSSRFKKSMNNYLVCSHVYQKGYNKGLQCYNSGHKFKCGIYCMKHKPKNKSIKQTEQNEQNEVYQNNSVNVLTNKKEIKPEERCIKNTVKGHQCKCRIFDKETKLCKRHYNLLNKSTQSV